MKRFLMLFGCLFGSVLMFAQVKSGCWDSAKCNYTNVDFKVSWTLPNNVEWKLLDIAGSNIRFKAIDLETQTMLILNIKNDQKYGSDIWSYYRSLSSKDYKEKIMKRANSSGVNIKSIDVFKCKIDNVNAIRTVTRLKKNDPAYGGYVDMVEVSCSIIYDNLLYTVDLRVPASVKDEPRRLETLVDVIYDGFKFLK